MKGKALLLSGVFFLGFSGIASPQSASSDNWMRKAVEQWKQEEEQKKARDENLLEKARETLKKECADFPQEIWGNPANYIVFHPLYLGFALKGAGQPIQVSKLEMKREYTASHKSGADSHSTTFLSYVVRVQQNLRDWVNSPFVRDKVVKGWQEMGLDKKRSYASKFFWVEERERGTPTGIDMNRGGKPQYMKFEGILQNEHVGFYSKTQSIGHSRSNMTIASGSGWGLWDTSGAGQLLGRVPVIMVSYKPEKDFCFYFQPITQTGDTAVSGLVKLFQGGLAQMGNVRALVDWKGWKTASLIVDTPDISYGRNIASREILIQSMDGRYGKDKGLVMRIDDSYTAYCFDKDYVKQFQKDYKALKDVQALTGLPTDYLSICGAMPYVPFLLLNQKDATGQNYLFEAKRSWYPYPVCIEFDDAVCTVGPKAVEVEILSKLSDRHTPLGERKGGELKSSLPITDENIEVLIGFLESMAGTKQ